MKHRARPKRRFWPAVAAAVLVAVVGSGTAVLVGGSGHDGASPTVAVSPAIRHAQVLAALANRARQPVVRHKHKVKHKPKRVHGRGSPSPHPSMPGSVPTPPSATPTTPSPSQTSSPASPTGPKTWAWCSSDAFGTFNTSDGFDLYNNEWNSSAHPGPQKICGNSGHDWQVTSTQRANNTEVLTYPSVQKNYPNRALSSFTSMTSSYAENMNSAAGTDAEAAYDIWINDLNKEVMFWVDNHGQTPAGSKVATVTLGGLTWNFYKTGGYYAFVLDHNAASGTVDLLAGLKYLMSHGDLSASDKLWQVNFGFEVCSTAGAPETFTVSNFTLASS
jgi:Glycosyl hydrolase family 12